MGFLYPKVDVNGTEKKKVFRKDIVFTAVNIYIDIIFTAVFIQGIYFSQQYL